MSLAARRVVFSLFALGFLTSAVAVLLYTNGYRYNFAKNRLELTGSLHVVSEPSGAEVYLEGGAELNFWRKTIQGQVPTTTARIKHLLPGSYSVNITHEGYWDWVKDIVITPGKTTFLSDVVMLRQDLPRRLYESGESVLFFKQIEGRNFLVGTSNSLVQIDMRTLETRSVLGTLPFEVSGYELSYDRSRVLVQFVDSRWGVIDVDGGNFILLSSVDGVQRTLLGQNGAVYQLSSAGIFSLEDDEFELLHEGDYEDIATDDGGVLYGVVQDQVFSSQRLLVRFPDGFKGGSGVVARIETGGGRILDFYGPYVALEAQDGAVRLADTRLTYRNIIELDKIEAPFWDSTDDTTFFVHNGYEVRRIDLLSDSFESTLLTRQGGVDSVFAFSDIPYVFIVRNGHEIVALGTTFGEPNRYSLYSSPLSDIHEIVGSWDDEGLYLVGSVSGKEGIYYLPLFN